MALSACSKLAIVDTTTKILLARNAALCVPLLISVRQKTYKKDLKYIFPYKVPKKFRVSPSTYVDQDFYKPKKPDPSGEAIWSSGERAHALPDCPITDYPQRTPDGGLRYYGFDYYPLDPDNVETMTKEEVSPLFMVRRVRTLIGIEWWHKNTLKALGIGSKERISKAVIVKNIPEMNEKLYSVKHLVEITPVKLPHNLPLDADPAHCSLTEEGELLYHPDSSIPAELLEDTEEMKHLHLSPEHINEECRNKWYDVWQLKMD